MTQAERTAVSDTRLFNAAMQLIGRQGANRTTLREICEHAGYSRGLANARFGSKDTFLHELLKHFNRAWQIELLAHVDGLRGYVALVAANRALEAFLRDNADYMRGGYLVWYESIGGDNTVRAKLKQNHDIYRRDVAQWITEGIADGEISDGCDAAQLGTFYCSWVFGTIFQWLADPDAMVLAEVFATFRSMLPGLMLRAAPSN